MRLPDGNMREKLLEMFHEYNAKYAIFCDCCLKDSPEELNSKMFGLADYLLSNDVTLTLDDIVPHGRWEYVEYRDGVHPVYVYRCTNCGTEKTVSEPKYLFPFKYCNNCGAKMDLNKI